MKKTYSKPEIKLFQLFDNKNNILSNSEYLKVNNSDSDEKVSEFEDLL